MQAKNDVHGGQKSTEVKYSELCSMATKTWSEESPIQVKDDDLHGGQKSTEFKILNNAL